jgi:hypothetical protein
MRRKPTLPIPPYYLSVTIGDWTFEAQGGEDQIDDHFRQWLEIYLGCMDEDEIETVGAESKDPATIKH